MIEKGVGWALARLAAGDDTQRNNAVLHELRGLPGGPLTAVFRIVTARCEDYGLGDNEPLRDSSGRDIQTTEGVILAQGTPDSARLDISAADLARARQDVAAAYRLFWQQEEDFPANYPSTPFPIMGSATGQPPLLLQDRGRIKIRKPSIKSRREISTLHQVSMIVAVSTMIGLTTGLGYKIITDDEPSPRPITSTSAPPPRPHPSTLPRRPPTTGI
jgi:hypothetical protein